MAEFKKVVVIQVTPQFLSGAMGDQGKIKSSVVPVREPSRDVRCALDI